MDERLKEIKERLAAFREGMAQEKWDRAAEAKVAALDDNAPDDIAWLIEQLELIQSIHKVNW